MLTSCIEAQAAPAEATSFVGRVDDIADAAARHRRGAAGHAHRDRRRRQDAPRRASRRRCVRPVRRWRLVVRAGPAHRRLRQSPRRWPRRSASAGNPTPASSTRSSHFLAPKRLLLVLDNCEHVLDGVRPLVEAILRGCPRVVVLATSRERLGMDGERVQPVAPLPLPDSERPLDVTAPAVALFVDRARAVRPDLELGAANLAAIVGRVPTPRRAATLPRARRRPDPIPQPGRPLRPDGRSASSSSLPPVLTRDDTALSEASSTGPTTS